MKTYVYLLIVLIPIYYIRIGILPTNVFEMLLAGALIAALADLAKKGRLSSLNSKVILPSILIISGLLLGLMVSSDKLSTLGIIKSWFVVPIAVYWLASIYFTGEQVKHVIKAITLSGVLVALYVTFQWLGFIGPVGYQIGDINYLRYVAEGRATGFFESPNYAAMYLAPIFFLSLLRVSSWRDPQLSGSLVILFALFATGSRGAILAVLLAAITVFTYYKKGTWGALFAVAVLTVLSATIYLHTSLQLGDGDNNRLGYYRSALEMIQSSPVAGIGAGQFYDNLIALCHTKQLGCVVDSSALHPHNLYLELLLSGGALLLAGFVLLVARAFKELIQRVQNATSTLQRFHLVLPSAALLVILFHGLVDTTYFKNDLSVIFWLIILVCLSSNGVQGLKSGRR